MVARAGPATIKALNGKLADILEVDREGFMVVYQARPFVFARGISCTTVLILPMMYNYMYMHRTDLNSKPSYSPRLHSPTLISMI